MIQHRKENKKDKESRKPPKQQKKEKESKHLTDEEDDKTVITADHTKVDLEDLIAAEQQEQKKEKEIGTIIDGKKSIPSCLQLKECSRTIK